MEYISISESRCVPSINKQIIDINNKDVNNSDVNIEDFEEGEMHDVPLAFGTSRKKRRKIEGKESCSIMDSNNSNTSNNSTNNSNSNKQKSIPNRLPRLPRSKGDKFVIEHNIMMCLYEVWYDVYMCIYIVM